MSSQFSPRWHALASYTLIVFGIGHGLGSLYDIWLPTNFAPADAALLESMRATPVKLGALLFGERMTMWRGHLGWNLSHSLGMLFVGLLQHHLRQRDRRLLATPGLLPLATGM